MKIGVDENCLLSFEMDEKEKGQLIDGFNKTMIQFGKMKTWFENSDVPAEQKLPYYKQLENMIFSLNNMMTIMEAAKINPLTVIQNLMLPF